MKNKVMRNLTHKSVELKELFNSLEDNIITCQENQIEFEKYLKDIKKSQEKILNKLK